MSGSKSCDGAGEVCSKLALAPGQLARWTCDGVNPYKADIPVGTVCQAVYVQIDPGRPFSLASLALFCGLDKSPKAQQRPLFLPSRFVLLFSNHNRRSLVKTIV